MTTAPRTHVQNPTDPVDGCALDKDGGGGGGAGGGGPPPGGAQAKWETGGPGPR